MAEIRFQTEGMRARDWLRDAVQRLTAGGIEGGERDARMLLAAAAGLSPLDLIRNGSAALAPAVVARLAGMLERRLAREPVTRILGEREFYGRRFLVTPATLDPRPETETLVEAALALVAEEGLADRPFRFLDIGTGTGCIAVTLLAELRAATALATDVSQAALDVAWKNAIRHGVSSRLEVQRRSFLEGVAGAFALAVSNPPYISSDEIGALDPEVRLHDPWAALDGGVDGLACFGRIIDGVSDVVPNGWVVLEVGAGQARQVVSLVERRLAGRVHPHVRTWRDLGGHSRVVAFKTQH